MRTESNYEDFRHPDEIVWSNDLLLDSKRRDFTINCMYYTNIPYVKEYTSLLDTKNINKHTDDETFLKRLDDHGYLFIKDANLLIIQDHAHIAKLFTEGIFQKEHLVSMLKSATIFSFNLHSKSNIQNSKLRIVIDPHK